MVPFPDHSWTLNTRAWPDFLTRGLGTRPLSPLGVFSPAKNHAILVVGVAGASVSLLAALITLRWFLLMRRSYRHYLILFLILSDTWKSLWYFIFPIVVFTTGHIHSSSNFCKAAGFLLSFGIEASDFAILMIALHTILYVFKRPQIKGEGGLYPYRKYIYPFWLGLPALSAGLAFTNKIDPYISSGTFCYLPKRPFWYRLALSWIPRYLIFLTIFSMYAAIWVYVNIKFRAFKDAEDSNYGSGSNSHNLPEKDHGKPFSKSFDFTAAKKPAREDLRIGSANSRHGPLQTERPPWEQVSFITSKPLLAAGGTPANMTPDAGSPIAEPNGTGRRVSVLSLDTEQDQAPKSRKQSEVLTLGTNFTGETAGAATANTSATVTATTPPITSTASHPKNGTTKELKSTRSAIRRQLRLLFIYPLAYVLMWMFPFVSHCLLYSDYYAAHPPFWLSVMTTASLSLQAGVDCLVFSWRERPWRRIEASSRAEAGGWWGALVAALSCTCEKIGEGGDGDEEDEEGGNPRQKQQEGSPDSSLTADVENGGAAAAKAKNQLRDSNWWEAEGRKRKDSVWMGTDQLQQIISRQEEEEAAEEADEAERERERRVEEGVARAKV